jgi:hypothetical protein
VPFQSRWDGDFPSLGRQVGPWIEHYLGIGLLSEQAHRLIRLYRIDPLTGARVFRRAALRAPKGKGKSPEGAYLGFAELCGPVMFDGWDANGQPVARPRTARDTFAPWIQFAAASEDQTDNVLVWLFEVLRERADHIAELGVDLGRTRIYLQGRPGRIEPVTAAAGSREGQPVTFAVLDQTEAWHRQNGGVRLANVLRRNVGKTGGWSMELQNAPEPGDGSVADRTARAWERGQVGVYFESKQPSKIPDLRDHEELLGALAEVYGESALHNGRGWVDLERIAAECVDADTEPSDAYRFYLNVERPSEERAFDGQRWAELADPRIGVPDRVLIVIGVDGARFDDALGIVGTHVETGHQFVIGIWERPERAGDDYEHPVDEADGAVLEAFERWNVWRVYVDPQWIDHLFTRWQGRWGEKVVLPWYTNRPKQMAYSLRNYRAAMTGGDLSNDGHPLMAAHIRNARKMPHLQLKDEDGHPMWTIRKDYRGSPRKIDAAMAGDLSWEARSDAIAAGVLAKRQRSRVPVSL